MKFTYASGQRVLGGYTLKRGIGRGGFGEVYYAVSGRFLLVSNRAPGLQAAVDRLLGEPNDEPAAPHLRGRRC